MSDREDGTAHGLRLHQLLRFVHDTGSCRDDAHVDEVLAAHGGDERTGDELRRHAERCPAGATAIGHEVEWARAHPGPPVFVATARFDAVWEHDGILDLRDYKTGRRADHAIADERRAWLQAWVGAPVAAARGLRVRVRYEHLAAEVDDDPEPWEPDADDLARIEAELVAAVSEMRGEREWHGVADAAVCARCRYRSICPDSASPAEPVWTAIDTGAEQEAAPAL